MDYINVGFVGLSYYTLYVQFHPKIGNIWYRNDQNNIKRLQLNNLVNLLKQPFERLDFWYFSNWDLNWITTTGIFIGAYHLYKTYI